MLAWRARPVGGSEGAARAIGTASGSTLMPQSFAEEFSSIPMSTHLGQSLERAHRFAREQSHRAVTLEHLLLALTEDAEAALILQAANIELGRLSTEVSGYLGPAARGYARRGGTEPRPTPSCCACCRRRRPRPSSRAGGRSTAPSCWRPSSATARAPAAGLLKAHGMTFEEAIRALQRANTKARLKPTPKPATPGCGTRSGRWQACTVRRADQRGGGACNRRRAEHRPTPRPGHRSRPRTSWPPHVPASSSARG